MLNATHKVVGPVSPKLGILCACLALFLLPGRLQADQVEMQNGDRYLGKVLSLNADTLVLQNEVLGTVRLPRGKVATISFGPAAGTAIPGNPLSTNALAHSPLLAPANTSTNALDLSAAFRQLGANSNLIRQVQTQFLSGAGPEANAKFNELLSGLMTGSLNLNDLRAQAQSAAEQARAARKELGDDAGMTMDGYLSILDAFLKETEPPAAARTNAPAAAPKRKPLLDQE
jgi:hypothetical protein